MKERRTGKVKEKIIEILQNVVAAKERLDSPGLSLAESLHNKIGGSDFVQFAGMFRELHALLNKEPYGPTRELVKEIYFTAHPLDIKEFFDRRKTQ